MSHGVIIGGKLGKSCLDCSAFEGADCILGMGNYNKVIAELKELGVSCWRARGSVFIWDEKVA